MHTCTQSMVCVFLKSRFLFFQGQDIWYKKQERCQAAEVHSAGGETSEIRWCKSTQTWRSQCQKVGERKEAERAKGTSTYF